MHGEVAQLSLGQQMLAHQLGGCEREQHLTAVASRRRSQ
jgi:hypothetical protein